MLKLYDTLSGETKPLSQRTGHPFSMYVCGITPYDHCHLGHARTLVAFDILRRWIEHSGIEVLHLQNVTDIDDKIIKRAQERKMMPLELSKKYDDLSRQEMKELGLLPPSVMPKISEHIPQTIALIEKIIANDSAYVTASGVYFDISTMPDYGKLSGQKLDKIRAGARIEVDEKKKNPEDFALWKLETVPGATYPSPWGEGRPGWHIECSAMSLHYTGGTPLDLHGGGQDLLFPHHENEIAQSEAAGTKPFARHWAHAGSLTVNGEKMSKSLGNFIVLREALGKWDAQVLRLFFGLTSYRSPVDFSETAIEAAGHTLANIRRSLSLMEGEGAKVGEAPEEKELADGLDAALAAFSKHMDEDLNTSLALAELIEASKLIARKREENKCAREKLQAACEKLASAFSWLGLEVGSRSESAVSKSSISKEEVESLIAARQEARKKKDFKTADAIRKQLADGGVILEDSKDGMQKWRYA